MAHYNFDIGIIGGGSAGLTVAAGAARLGAKTILIEKEKELGGDCLHYGCVPSKTLIRTATIYHGIKHAKEYGLPSVEVPPVDFKDVSRRINSVIHTIQKHDSAERFCDLGAKVEFGAPEFIDEHSVRMDGRTISAKTWVISTGSSPGVAPIEGLDTTPYITNREIFYLDSLPKSLIVVGAGPIGIEMAQAFCRLGTEVSVIQRSSQILSKEDRDMADSLMEILKTEGVKFYTDSTPIRVKDMGTLKEVVIKTGEAERSLKAETILIALGRNANTQGLSLEKIGVEVGKRGLKVDNRLRTTQKHIYAAGDVTGAFQFTHAAGYEGGIVIANAVFRLPRKVNYTFMPWCTYTEPELANIGMNEKMAKNAGINYKVWTEEFRDNDRSLAEGGHGGKIKLLLNEKEKPIGVQILGKSAGELVSEWVASLNGGVKLSTLAGAVHPYPTLGEINKKIAGAFISEKIFSKKIKWGLKFFFNLRGRACGKD